MATKEATTTRNGMSTMVVLFKSLNTRRKRTSKFRNVAWILLVELPLVIVFSISLFMAGLSRIEFEYLHPHLKANVFTKERQEQEVTYYNRMCSPEDVSTLNARDLYLVNNSQPTHSYKTFLRHGAAVFPSVLSRETATKLRDFIIAKNLKQAPEESEFLHSPTNRWVVEIGFDEDPIVATALAEISMNPLLRSTLQEIFGIPDSALIELNAITSAYGCQNQSWHSDGVSNRSPMIYGRSFVPTNVMLTTLQDTTPEMGATAVCPGTHYCSDYTPETCSGEYQIPAITHPDLDYWPAGHGLLMTTNTYHRGTAFVDPNAAYKYRVVLITTLSPVRQKRYETRQLSHGLSYSLKWYMWGHALNDLVRGLKRPWSDLTSFGLYKRLGSLWGYDFVTGFLQRMDSADCCTLTNESLYKFVKKGGIRWLPKFLHGEYSLPESYYKGVTWYNYLADTVHRCSRFASIVHFSIATAYVIVTLIRLLFQRSHPGKSKIGLCQWTWFRILGSYALVYTISLVIGTTIVNKASWTRDIRGRRKDVVTFPLQTSAYEGPSTFPMSSDVLIGTRLDSRHLGMYTDFLQYHPGNYLWHSVILNRLEWISRYHDLSHGLQQKLAEGIVYEMMEEHESRFLYQVPSSGDWIILDAETAVNLTVQEIFLQGQPFLQIIAREIRFLRSKCIYGPLRETKLCQFGGSSLLKILEKQILKPKAVTDSRQPCSSMKLAKKRTRSYVPRTVCVFPISMSSRKRLNTTASPFPVRFDYKLDRRSTMPKTGDVVHVLDGSYWNEQSQAFQPAWWPGTVISAHPLGKFLLQFANTEERKQYGLDRVCIFEDEECLDAAELQDGWSLDENGNDSSSPFPIVKTET